MKFNFRSVNLIILVLAAVTFFGCGSANESNTEAEVIGEPFGETGDGTPVDLYTLRNENGMEVRITNYGGIITSLTAPGKDGAFEDVVLGFDSLEKYLSGHPYFGAIVGRYANRIAGGQFTLNGEMYTLTTNNGPKHLHGGDRGFDKRVWEVRDEGVGERGPYLTLHHLSVDGDEGYPGNLSATVTYTLTGENALRIDYEAETDETTILNLSNHSYFNLAGAGEGNILDHRLTINADRFTAVDSTLIPTGELRSVEGTPMDFTEPTPIGARIDSAYRQLEYGGGYDHNYVLNKDETGAMTLAARVYEPSSGRVMKVRTTQPGVQFYTGNFLDGSLTGKGGHVYERRYGFCLETQHFPDSPHHDNFPSVTLNPGETYRQTTVYEFDVRSSS
jgi:aldose 1-epimerase